MISVRPIQPQDDLAIASVIREVMSHYDVDPSTTILGDPTLNRMYQTYQQERAIYFVSTLNGKIVGGCGIRQLDGSTDNICELQRMFLLPEARRQGIGKSLMEACLAKAEEFAYDQIYLETLCQMREAQQLYVRYGFENIPNSLGDTGHCGCDVKMLKSL